MKNIFAFIILSISTLTGLSQQKLKMWKSDSKFGPDVHILEPFAESYIIEYHHNYRGFFWMRSSRDTLKKNSDGTYSGKRGKVDLSKFDTEIGECDSLINVVRNADIASVSKERLSLFISNVEAFDEEEYHTVSKSQLDVRNYSSVCSSEFKSVAEEWEKEQTALVQKISERRKEELRLVRENPQTLDVVRIRLFLRDMDRYAADMQTLDWIIRTKTTEFLEGAEAPQSFVNLKYNLKNLAKVADTKQLSEIVKASSVKTPNKQKIIRKLRKA